MTAPSATGRELAGLVHAWLESLRDHAPLPVPCLEPLEAALLAERLFHATREREGVVRAAGQLTVERLDVPPPDGPTVTVDVAASISFPADEVAPGSRAADPAYRIPECVATAVEVGPVTFSRLPGGWRLDDWTVDGRALSDTWCTHPTGEDAGAGMAAVTQAVHRRDRRTGTLYIEIANTRADDVVVAVGRPAGQGRRGLLRRGPGPEQAEPRGLPVAAGDVAHLAGRTIRPDDTDVELSVYDDRSRLLVASLDLAVRLPEGHPAGGGTWCGYPSVTSTAPTAGGSS